MGKARAKQVPEKESLPTATKRSVRDVLVGVLGIVVLIVAAYVGLHRQGSTPAFKVTRPDLVGSLRTVALTQSDPRCCAKTAQVLSEPDGTVIAAIAEDFLCKPEQMVKAARMAKWDHKIPGQRAYPGSQAWLDQKLSQTTHSCMMPVIRAVFGEDSAAGLESVRSQDQDMFFGLAWFPESELIDMQKVPHIDVSEPNGRASGYACVASLTHRFNNNGGIGIYRQHGTNISLVTTREAESSRLDYLLNEQIPNGLSIDDAMPGYYSVPGNVMFDELAVAGLQYNRVVLYDIRRQHASYVPDAAALTKNPKTGRLTLNGFLYRSTSEICKTQTTCPECRSTFACAWCRNSGKCVQDVSGACGKGEDGALVGRTSNDWECPASD